MRALVSAVTAGFLLAGCGASSTANATGPHLLLVFTTWVADSRVTNGPEPGYKPALTGLTSHDIQSASAALDSTGTSWVVNIVFTPGGAKQFADLTRANVGACPGDPATDPNANCAQRHLSIWLELNQADIDHWEERTYVANVAARFDLDCLKKAEVSTQCPKLVSDPITIDAITGGEAQIAGSFTQQTANDFATAIT